MRRFVNNLTRLDKWLALGGLVSVVFVLVVGPIVHPDGLSTEHLSDAEVSGQAAKFLNSLGHDVSDLRPAVTYRREDRLLIALQNQLGRKELLRPSNKIAERWPTHHYVVSYFSNDRSGEIEDAFELKLTSSGSVWDFDVSRNDVASDPRQTDRTINRAALQSLSRSDTTADMARLAGLTALPDTALVRRLHFDPLSFRDDVGARNFLPQALGNPNLRPNTLVRLGPDAAVALARYYLPRHSFSSEEFVVDSVWHERGDFAAVKLSSTDSVTGVEETKRVMVNPVGGLEGVTTTFEAPERGNSRWIGIAGVAVFVIYGLLALIVLVIFFRRLMLRAIDVKASLIDAAVMSLVFIAFVVVLQGLHDPAIPFSLRLVGLAASAGIGGGVVAIFVFLVSGAADSLARRAWSEKLFSSSLLRQGVILNGFVGSSITRGLSVGLITAAISMLALAVFPNESLLLRGSTFSSSSIQPAVFSIGLSFLGGYFNSIVLVLTVGALLYRKGRSKWVVIVPVVVVLALARISPYEFLNPWIGWGTSAAIGLVFAAALWYLDLLTLFVGFVVNSLFWLMYMAWLQGGSVHAMDISIIGLFLALIFGVGFVGVRSGRQEVESLEYVPQYLVELSEQQRLEREWEIARQVQESFLPSEMPSMDDLDIAATCIAAELVGGDYYDFIELGPKKLAVALGDVSGKGIQAAFYMTLTKGFLRSLCRESESPAQVLRKINALFRENAPRGTFISLVYGIIDLGEKTFTFGRAGHNPIIHKKEGEEAVLVTPAGLGIGLATGQQFAAAITEATINVEAGDTIVLYTDGFSEARNLRGDEFGESRLATTISSVTGSQAQMVLDEVCGVVDKFVGDGAAHDDRTMMVIRFSETDTNGGTLQGAEMQSGGKV